MNETIQTSQAVQTVTTMVEQIKGLPYFTKIKFITIIHKLASDEQLDEIPDVTEALDHLNELREFLFNLKYALMAFLWLPPNFGLGGVFNLTQSWRSTRAGRS